MGKKRKLNSNSIVEKSSPVEVIIKDVTSHPLCLHGPTLLFSTEKGRYYACALCRDKKQCTVHIDEDDWQKDGVKKRNEKYYSLIPKIDKATAWRHLNEIKSRHYSDRAYCSTCQELFLHSQSKKHGKEHHVITPLTEEHLSNPSSWLPTLENNAVEAQYIFAKKSVKTILAILKNNNISNILCIGTPSVHEAAQVSEDFDSLLLDYDKRHHQFNQPTKFIWYNMFNNYIFNGNEDEKTLKKFLKKSKGSLCIVMDPPFGGRVEPLVQTLRELSTTYRKVCEMPDNVALPVLWAFPYFSEPYITNLMPEMKMHDFQVEYTNHKKFQNKNKSGRKNGSPVRFFTNLPLITIDLSNDNNYKLCDKCNFFVSATNNHCTKCEGCTSKNGMTYRHCNICKKCVKPTYKHCKECGRCVQEKHRCGIVVESQSCFNCREKGHKRSECPQLDEGAKKKKRKHA